MPPPETEQKREEEEEPTEFRVAFEGNVPRVHDGASPVVFRIAFSQGPDEKVSSSHLRFRALMIKNGSPRVKPTGARRLDPPSNKRWEISISQMGSFYTVTDDFTISLGPRDCDHADAVCSADEEKLTNSIFARVRGPSRLSAADATVTEAANATMDFAVTLSRSSSEAVTVDYATLDGTTTVGSDYTDTSGTLTFDAGETEKTVSVPVLDDAVDEGSEGVHGRAGILSSLFLRGNMLTGSSITFNRETGRGGMLSF